MITWGHVTHWKLNISSFARSMITKHGRLVTYGKRSPPSLESIFGARVMVFCLWENVKIIFEYWLPTNSANFSWVGENFCVFRFYILAISLSKFLFSIVKKWQIFPCSWCFTYIICSTTYMFLGIWQIEISFSIKEVCHSLTVLGQFQKAKETWEIYSKQNCEIYST